MNIFSGMVLNGFETFLLVFVRMTGLFVIAPIFGRQNVPTHTKIGFAFFNAVILVNTVSLQKADMDAGIFEYALLVGKEFLVGVAIGYVAYMFFSAIYTAGQLIDTQIGFGMVNVLDPLSNIQISVTSNFYYIMCMLVFLTIKGHHALIKALFDSYSLIPIGKAAFNDILLNDLLRIFAETFSIGFRICAPVTAAIIVVDVALGIISKSIPQINVFVVGIPLKLIVGMALLIITLPYFMSLIKSLTALINSETMNILKDLVPAK